MSSMLSFQIRQQAQQQQQQKQQEKASNAGGLPSPPNSFCGEETATTTTTTIHEKPAFLAQTRRDSLQTVFNDMHIKDYSTSLPENYTIDHSSSSVPRKHLAPTMAGTATATAAATGGLTIRNSNRRPSDIMASNSSSSLGMGGRRKSSASRGLSESFSGQYRCTDCGKSYKHPNCLQKHRWEHSEEWELTKKLPLTKHQQVQMLEAAAILIGMDRIRSDVKKEEKQEDEEEEEEEEDIVVEEEEEEEEIDLDDIGENDRKETLAKDDDDDESIIIDDDDSIFMEDL
ncbi:ubiquitin C-terminal hydrolase Ubp14 [Mucor velutinosus]|uniref:Ubiquitin C-terminal hydrolase Ubp14 n=1 Tax=Mucor velutinosus TaxID=708070 RepID=A0AAN7HR32_9FUNG|nr:ubiquitin C-terminal hydrolase Ubp14 [Mucor velutinosus]